MGRKANNGTLTVREAEILSLIHEGLSSRDMAKRLFVSYRTIGFHINNAYEKIGVHNRVNAARWYRENGAGR